MAKKKAKWLEEATTKELTIQLQEILNGELDDKALSKAQKISDELVERLPEDSENLSVMEALEEAKNLLEESLNNISVAYQTEVDSVAGEDEDEEDDEDEEEEEPAPEKSKKLADKKSKKSKKDEDEEEDEEEDDEDDEDEEEDYSELSLKSLKTECRKRGLKVNKGAKKSELIKLLEADDKD